MDRLEQVGGGDALAACEVGDGAGDLEHAVVGARGEAEALHRLLEQVALGPFQGGVLAQLGRAHRGVAPTVALAEATSLDGAGGLDTRAHGGRRFAGLGGTELVDAEGGRLDLDVDAVEQRAGDAVAVALDGGR